MKKITALIVEDEINCLEILTGILDDIKQVEYQSTRSSKTALNYFAKSKPDITFLDIDIPPPNGIETLRMMREISPDAKIVMVTGCTEVEVVKRAIALGAFGYVVKPFAPSKIHSVLQKLHG